MLSGDSKQSTESADSSSAENPVRRWFRRQHVLLFMLLATNRGLVTLSILGLLCGVAVGALMVGFETAVALLQEQFGLEEADRFATLPTERRALLPLAAALMLGILFSLLPKAKREVGVGHVIERMERHDAKLPPGNAAAQAVGAVASIAGGFSVGREGPGVHLGAALASLLGTRLALPANALRILAACGAAAAIAASFNTPLAGVIFAMEVILMEYSLIGFAPVMLAAVAATTVTRVAYGSAVTFAVPAFGLNSLLELPWLILMGFLIGIMAIAYLRLIDRFSRFARDRLPLISFLIAGLITSGIAIVAPEALGIGYATTNSALIGQIGIGMAILILAAKLIASSAAVGLGIPGGLIGPTIVMGALAGLILGHVGGLIAPTDTSSLAFYALIGMGTMMGATLQTPLAALIAMLELTGNPNIILPGMLTLMTAFLTNRLLFGEQPAFLYLLARAGKPLRHDPRIGALQQTTVAASLNTSVAEVTPKPTVAELNQLARSSTWLLLRDQGRLIRSKPLREWLERKDYTARDTVDMMQLPIAHETCAEVDAGASLYSALLQLRAGKLSALYATRPGRKDQRLFGVLTEDAITGKLVL